MGYVKDMAACRIGNEIVCDECITDEESQNLTQDEIITQDEIENDDGFFFCDRCKYRIFE